jgi:two-component system LytT family sensor kinase
MLNALGHVAGALIFGNFLSLLLRSSSVRRVYASKLALIAATLAFVWNLASLAVILTGEPSGLTGQLFAAVAFCAISLLPAVLLSISLSERFSGLVKVGYAISGLAAAAHAIEVLQGAPIYHSLGLIVIATGFGLLTIVAVSRTLWSREDNRRATISRLLAAMSLFLFAISFVHFNEERMPRAWFTELLLHHAGIPVALFILIQDYRFVFLDAFIRFLANGLLAGLFGFAIAVSLTGLSVPAQSVVAGVLLAFFALTRAAALRFLSKIVFREVNTDTVLSKIQGLPAKVSGEQEYVRAAFLEIAAAVNAQVVEKVDVKIRPKELLAPTLAATLPEARQLHSEGVEVIVPVRQANTTSLVLLGERRSGRRYLSKDLDTLAHLAAHVARQADQIRETEMRRLVSEAELRALQAQIHPHFLFNALNTLYGTIPREAQTARETLLSLSQILRYFLGSEQTYIPVEEELRVIKAYLAIESLRLGPKLKTSIHVEDGVSKQLIPIFSVEPLVENAVKHGIAPRSNGGEVRIEIRRRERGIYINVWDSGLGFGHGVDAPEHAGIGLRNVSRRLELCYGSGSRLEIQSGSGGTSVGFWAPFTGEVEGVRSTMETARGANSH